MDFYNGHGRPWSINTQEQPQQNLKDLNRQRHQTRFQKMPNYGK